MKVRDVSSAVTKEQLETIEGLANRGERFRADTMLDLVAAVRDRDATIAKFTAIRDEIADRDAEIARLRDVLARASCDLASGDARAVMVRTGIDLALAKVPGSVPDPRDARIAKLEAAIRNVITLAWNHGEDCPHRNCDTDNGCNDGTMSDEDGCESPGDLCDCHMDELADLAALLPVVVPAVPS